MPQNEGQNKRLVSKKDSVRVTIFGDSYSIKSDVDIELTQRIATFVDSKMDELYRSGVSKDKLKIAILSALNIAGELFEVRSQRAQQQSEIRALEQKASQIASVIEQKL